MFCARTAHACDGTLVFLGSGQQGKRSVGLLRPRGVRINVVRTHKTGKGSTIPMLYWNTAARLRICVLVALFEGSGRTVQPT